MKIWALKISKLGIKLMEAFMEHELTNVLVISSMIYICISHLLKRLTDGDWSQWIFGDWRQWKSTIHQIVNHQIVTYTDWRSSGYLSNYFTKIYTHSWSIFDVMSALVTVLSIQTEIRETPIKQAEKLKSRKMKNDEGWRMNEEGWGMNDEGWWFQALEGFWWWMNRQTDICDCRVGFTTEKRHLYHIWLIMFCKSCSLVSMSYVEYVVMKCYNDSGGGGV